MDQVRAFTLTLVAVGAEISVAGLALGLYQVTSGRLVARRLIFLQSLSRQIPATPEDTRKNGWAVALNDLAILLLDVMILGGLLLQKVRFDPVFAISYAIVSLAGFAAIFMAIFAAAHVRRQVHYLPGKTSASIWSAPGPPTV